MKETKTELQIRRAPKFLSFLITGGLIGLVAAVIASISISSNAPDATPIVGYLIGWLTALGAALGIIAAVIVERIYSVRSKQVPATKLEE